MDGAVVIFRMDREGNVFALFPELPADHDGIYCTCFENIGQPCAADYDGCIPESRPAAPREYADLQEELERRGYRLLIRRRATRMMHERRRSTAAGWRGSQVRLLRSKP